MIFKVSFNPTNSGILWTMSSFRSVSSPSITWKVFIPFKPGRFHMIFWKLFLCGALSVCLVIPSETLPGLWNCFSSSLQVLDSPHADQGCWGSLNGQRFLFEHPLTGNIVQILLLAFSIASCSNFRESPVSQVGLGVGCTWQRSCWEDFCSDRADKLRHCPNPEIKENKIGGITSFQIPVMVWVSNAVLS